MRNRGLWKEEPPQACSPRNFVLSQIPHAGNVTSPAGPSRSTATIAPPQSAFESSFNFTQPVPDPPNAGAPPSPVARLHVTSLPLKSRVETQANVKLTLDPVPAHVTKLHLQPYTISKAKLLAKPTPEPASDMYELYTTLVCSSAMQIPEKFHQALTRAAITIDPPKRRDARRSSADDATSTENDEDKPLNGGPVNVCLGCVERERKRAARKKTKNPEDEEIWLKDETQRIVVFNTQEVKEWQTPCTTNPADEPHRNLLPVAQTPVFSQHARQVDVPMRIACYCRHQEEKLGFRYVGTEAALILLTES